MDTPGLARGALRILLLVLIAYAGFAVLVWLFAERLIFMPPGERYARDEQVLLIPRADGGSVAAVHLRNPDARYTVLFSHGNAEHVVHGLDHLQGMRDAGFSVLAYDYSGYGLSMGRPSERAAYADVEAAYDYLVRTRGRAAGAHHPARPVAGRRGGGGPGAAGAPPRGWCWKAPSPRRTASYGRIPSSRSTAFARRASCRASACPCW